MKFLVFAISCIFSIVSFAQKNVFIDISPKVAGADLQFGVNLVNVDGLVFQLEYFDYYLSDLHIIHDGGQDLALTDTVFLVEPGNHVLYLGYLNVTTIESVNFAVGVPADINTSAGANAVDISAQPAGHPLSFQDPSMYWGWTAGYMHMIIGGTADSNNDGTADAIFQLHNIGDLNYRHVQIPVVQTDSYVDQIDVHMNCNVDVWLKNIPIETVGVSHGSTGFNSQVMKNINNFVVFDQSAMAAVTSLEQKTGSLFFNNSGNSVQVTWKSVVGMDSYNLIDASGKVIQSGKTDLINGTMEFENLASGMYTFQMFNAKQIELNSIKVIR